jgi:hypothetical protein
MVRFECVFGERASTFGVFFALISRPQQTTATAPFLKCGTQTYASDASAVWGNDPKPREWLSGLAAGWRLS